MGLTGTSRVIDGGRITIDQAIREALDISIGDTVEYTIEQVIKSKEQKRK
jgi:bifunctional DNA-binding transcriptional regulator/antitoxin component of YhaV-PrlF toxin-antitoxin module